MVKNMKKRKYDKELIINEPDILTKCILSKYKLSSNTWSMVLEKDIKERFNLTPPDDNTSGDCKSSNGCNIEIKISLGDSNGKVNFVQLRPGHKIDYYLFLVYNIFDGDLGKVYWFLIPSNELYKLLPTYGSYSHGTISELGKISLTSIISNSSYEYSLRPNPVKPGKSKDLWDILVDTFSKTEDEIKTILL